MMKVSILVLGVLCCATVVCRGQSATTGIPYFQQHVHYVLNASMQDDWSSPRLNGTGYLDYTNHSPDTLHELYFHLYWNLFNHGSYGESAPNRDHSVDQKYGHGGIDVQSWTLEGSGTKVTPRVTIDNTIARVELQSPLRPGETIRVAFQWTGLFPNYGIRSTWGFHDGYARTFATAQWYPQVCVYDNYGWHPDQYIGMGEFYTDYGSFDVALTLPTRFSTVVSTGYATNLDSIEPRYIAQLQVARSHPDSIVQIVDNSDFKYTPISRDEPMRTWRFHADSVRDFAWDADEASIWDAIYRDGIMRSALFWNGSRALWQNQGARIADFTITHNSNLAGRYMYPNAFLCETYEGGMEYPGIVFVGPYTDSSHHWAQNTMMHELGHEWYPMMMGSNETDYGYMDEGFNTFLTTLTHEAYFGRYRNAGAGSRDDERTANYRGALMQQIDGLQEPTKQKADAFLNYRDYAEATYPHTGTVLFMLRYTMGEPAFNDFLQLYYNRWKFKHPYPDDLLDAANDIERVEGDTNRVRARGDLRWFFDEWFDKTWQLDYDLASFHHDGNTATVQIDNHGRAVMPLDLVFTLHDGSHVTKWIPVDDWLRTVADSRTYSFTFDQEPIAVAINPTNELLDVNRLNNQSGCFPPMSANFNPFHWLTDPTEAPLIDSYEIRSTPWIAPAWQFEPANHGIAIGWTFTGSYLGMEDRLAVGPRVEWSNAIAYLGGVAQYHNVLQTVSPFTDIDLGIASIGASQLAEISMQQIVEDRESLEPVHIFNVGYSLIGPLFASDGFPINRVVGGYTYHHAAARNTFTVGGQIEAGLGDPRTTYSKLAGVINDRMTLGSSWNLFLRAFGGTMQPIANRLNGAPQQVLFNLTGSSSADKLEDLYASNFGSALRSKIRNLATSGPMLRGYQDVLGRVAGSATVELNSYTLSPERWLSALIGWRHEPLIDLSLFADAGFTSDAFCTCNLQKEIREDAGVGLRFLGFGRRIDAGWNMDFERSEFRLDVPLWLSNPDDGHPRWAPRLVAEVRQNF